MHLYGQVHFREILWVYRREVDVQGEYQDIDEDYDYISFINKTAKNASNGKLDKFLKEYMKQILSI